MRNWYFNLIFLLIIYPSIFTGSTAEVTIGTSNLPSRHIIPGVTLHKQLNGLGCGPASIETVFDYWGADIDQKAIADVARTSSIGTYTWDIVRAGHFSHLSRAQGRFFPHDAPTEGFAGRPLGYSSFSYSSDTFWWTDLKGLIASDIPVILLMKYAPDDYTGHYRVMVGYDEDEEVVYFVDPWDRDLGKIVDSNGMVEWPMADFKDAWNYDEYGASSPHWGAVMMPWEIDLRTTGKSIAGSVLKVTAIITYPCQEPFDHSSYPASDVYVEIRLPAGMKVLGRSTINIGELSAGESVTVSWSVKLESDGAGASISVRAGGLISGEVGEAFWKGSRSYEPYNYIDEIGGEGCKSL